MAQLDHPNVVKLYEVFDEEDYFFLVIELLSGGELFDRIVDSDVYTEHEASETIRPIVDAIRYCHSIGVIHRDLKPENLIYLNNDEASPLKITDFGVARFLSTHDIATTAVGSPHYIAPEVIVGKGYGKEVDFWGIGVIIYIM
jgi:calcium/calmodulin-dependent protein kinase I